MSFLLRVVLAVVAGIVTTTVLDHYGVLTAFVNFLLGVAVAVVVYKAIDDPKHV